MAARYRRESPLQNKESPLLCRVLSPWLIVSLLLLYGMPCDAGANHDLNSAIDDIPEPIDSIRVRTESDEDRALAAAQVAMGRLFLQRKQFKLALKSYQRAHRDDPHSVSVMADIVQLQLALHREEEAARYALLDTDTRDQDPALLRQLAMMLTEQLDFSGAIKLYERSATFDMKRKPDAGTVLIHLEK
jgi:tetratricopeptide (TPR) repeat protein